MLILVEMALCKYLKDETWKHEIGVAVDLLHEIV
jgi:hypothetical protein